MYVTGNLTKIIMYYSSQILGNLLPKKLKTPKFEVNMGSSIGKKIQVFLPFAFGFFLSYLYRVVNAVLAPDLASDLGVGPAELGL